MTFLCVLVSCKLRDQNDNVTRLFMFLEMQNLATSAAASSFFRSLGPLWLNFGGILNKATCSRSEYALKYCEEVRPPCPSMPLANDCS